MFEKDIDRDGQFKLYVKIYYIIRRMIEEGKWQPNSKIPSEDELSKMFGVSKTTLRLALFILSQEGYLRRQQGKGTFVTSPLPEYGLTMITRVSDSLFKEETANERELLKKGINMFDEDVQDLLNYKGEIFYIRCNNLKNGKPICIEELYIPKLYFQGVADETVCDLSFLDIIKKRSIRKIYRITQTVQISWAKDDIAKLMKINKGDPILLINKIFRDIEDKVIAYIRLSANSIYKLESDFVSIR